MITRNRRIEVVYGAEAPARGILLAMYISILVVSAVLVPMIFINNSVIEAIWMATGLFLVQIIYKFASWFTTNGGIPENMKFNPVILSNVAIAIFHLVTVVIVVSGWS
jgi:hypothetical protein